MDLRTGGREGLANRIDIDIADVGQFLTWLRLRISYLK
jgi:hypothetical protein